MNILNKIVEQKKLEVKKLRSDYSISRFSDSIFFNSDNLSLNNALTTSKNISIIAEVKKASPSKGIFISDFDYMNIAEQYMKYGANAISVLTDNLFFKGNIENLNNIARVKEVPLLRKDFIIDEYQVYEAKSNGADAILLISEILSANQISELTAAAFENKLEVLLEIHNAEQLTKINFEKNNLIGINNRNLEDFSVDIKTSVKVSKLIPAGCTVVSESGINNKYAIDFLQHENINAILVGEYLIKSQNLKMALELLLEYCSREK